MREKICDLDSRLAIWTYLLVSNLVSKCNRYIVITNLIETIDRRYK